MTKVWNHVKEKWEKINSTGNMFFFCTELAQHKKVLTLTEL